MYLELVTTSTAVQQSLANAYASSGRMEEIGLYMLALSSATIGFYGAVEPPDKCRALHEAHMKWLQLGIEALTEEMAAGQAVDSEKSRQFVQAAQAFVQSLSELGAEPPS